MALIPYQVIPDLRDPALVPSGGLTGHALVESYCGDARCDCAVATLILDGYPLLVDLGTGRVDVTGTQRPLPPHQAAQRLLREALRAQVDLLPRLRAHYAAAREYGLREHYRFVDWTRRPPRDPVLFEEILRADGGHPWVLTLPDGKQAEAKRATVLLHDGFCVDRGCDCHKATFVVGLQTGGPPRRLGSVEVNLRTGEPKVLQAEPNMEPNQLFMMVLALIQQHGDLLPFYSERYRQARELLIPVIALQRRQQTEQRQERPFVGPGRNDPCPCGSGKKFKKCHGA